MLLSDQFMTRKGMMDEKDQEEKKSNISYSYMKTSSSFTLHRSYKDDVKQEEGRGQAQGRG